MKKTTYNKIIQLFSKFIIGRKRRNQFRKKFLITNYQINRDNYNIGEHSYVVGEAKNIEIISPKTVIGKYCSIAKDVLLGLSCHPLNRITTHPLTCIQERNEVYGDFVTPNECVLPLPEVEPITIENDVWIGRRVIVMNGVTISNGAVVAAGAVVTKDIPPYEVWAGVPAKFIKKRFSDEIIAKLLDLKWWDYPKSFIAKLPFDNVEKCIEILENNIH